MEILAHGRCRLCDALHPSAILDRSGGLCENCISRGLAPTPIRVRVGSAVIELPKHQKYKATKGRRDTRSKVRAAREAAMKRLRDAYPEVYRMIYLEERANRGLAPVPLQLSPLDAEALAAQMRAGDTDFDMDAVLRALGDREDA